MMVKFANINVSTSYELYQIVQISVLRTFITVAMIMMNDYLTIVPCLRLLQIGIGVRYA